MPDQEPSNITSVALADLNPGDELQGKVTKIELFGAFVDVGAELPGLLHISQLKRGHVKRVEDEVKEGDLLQVWVHAVDKNAKRLELTRIKPVTMQWKDIKSGMIVKGEVVRLEKFGAFVDIGAERPGLLHVSEMQDEFVSDPGEIVSVGDQIEVRVIDVDRKKRQIRLSLKALDFIEVDEEEEEEVPTAMELALRQALGQADEPAKEKKADVAPKRKRNRKELEDILSRTLAQKVQTASTKE